MVCEPLLSLSNCSLTCWARSFHSLSCFHRQASLQGTAFALAPDQVSFHHRPKMAYLCQESLSPPSRQSECGNAEASSSPLSSFRSSSQRPIGSSSLSWADLKNRSFVC